MDWTQVFVLIASNFGLFLWVRSESRQDHRQVIDLISAIEREMKDFHGRLCAIEERNKK